MTRRMHRRLFLRGLGGAVVAAPFLGSVWERATKAQTLPRPRQLIGMFTHYGCVTTKWFPAKSHGALTAGDITNSLAPLAPYVSKLLIPRGMRGMNEWTQSNTGAGHGRGQGNDPHLNAAASHLTLQPVTPNTDEPFSFDTATKFNARPVGSSLDHVIAQQLSPNGVPLFMRVGNRLDNAQSAISYLKAPGAAAGDPATIHAGFGTPSSIFSALTGLFTPGTSPSPDSYAAARGKKISDLVKGDLEALKRMDMSAADRSKIEVWESILNETSPAVTPSQCSMDLATRLGATQANADAVGTVAAGKDILTSMVTSDLDGADMYSVMAVLSAVCNYNPVMLLKYPPNFVFTGLGITVDTDGLAHRTGNASMSGPCVANALAMLRTIDTYYATKFAKLVGLLDGVKNADGSTLLDDTAAVWLHDVSDGAAENLNNLPIIQAGSCGGYFKTGWAINVDTANTGAANLTQGGSELQCADGTPSGTFNGIDQSTGTAAAIANAPINKYFYNLMNALGVKGDDNGFPSKTGTAAVSRFGYSDLTTDFCGGLGAVAGATIHSPGEYLALKK